MYLLLVTVLCFLGSVTTDRADDDFAITYLKRYGYLAENTLRTSENAMTSAIINMQKEFGLKLTGALDSVTLTAMQKPRCAISDFGTQNHIRFVNKWPSPHFYYHIENTTSDLGKERTEELLKQAQREWAKVTPITYTEVADKDKKSANISIRFLPDIPGNAVAVAYLPYCTGYPCTVSFDETVEWTESWPPEKRKCFTLVVGNSHKNTKTLSLPSSTFICPSKVDKTNWLGGARFGDTFAVMQNGAKVTVRRTDSNGGWGMSLRFECCSGGGVNFLLTAIHELGHTLGLKHSQYEDSVMYPSVSYRKKDIALSNEDIWKVQSRYGVKGTAAPPPTTPNPCRDRAPGCDKYKHRCFDEGMEDFRKNCKRTCGDCTP